MERITAAEQERRRGFPRALELFKTKPNRGGATQRLFSKQTQFERAALRDVRVRTATTAAGVYAVRSRPELMPVCAPLCFEVFAHVKVTGHAVALNRSGEAKA